MRYEYRKRWILTPRGAETHEPISMKSAIHDYVRDANPHDKFGVNSSTRVVWANRRRVFPCNDVTFGSLVQKWAPLSLAPPPKFGKFFNTQTFCPQNPPTSSPKPNQFCWLKTN